MPLSSMSSVLGSGDAVNEPSTPFGWVVLPAFGSSNMAVELASSRQRTAGLIAWQDAIAEELANVSIGKIKRHSVYVKIKPPPNG